jgi:polar amino acid transport system substrate-binding protein
MSMRLALKLTGLAILAAGMLSAAANAGTLEDIKSRGTLVVGTKADYPPYGLRDSSGNIVGLEPDLAADIAKRLGVKLQLEPVVAANRMQFLQQGKIDLMIATMNVTPEREKAVGIVQPHYYAGGVAIIVNKAANVKSAADLKGKPVCAIQGSFYNNRIQSEFTGQDLVAFKGVPENETALLSGQCVGFVYDDVLLVYKKKAEGDKWKSYDVIVLKEFDPIPWGAAVRLEDRDAEWGKFVGAAIADWHKSGFLLEKEKQWLGENTGWLKDANAKAK